MQVLSCSMLRYTSYTSFDHLVAERGFIMCQNRQAAYRKFQLLTEASEFSSAISLQLLSCSMLRYTGYTNVWCSTLEEAVHLSIYDCWRICCCFCCCPCGGCCCCCCLRDVRKVGNVRKVTQQQTKCVMCEKLSTCCIHSVQISFALHG